MNYINQAETIAQTVTDLDSGARAVEQIKRLRVRCINEMRDAADVGDNDRYDELSTTRYDLLQYVRQVQNQMGKFAAVKMAQKGN